VHPDIMGIKLFSKEKTYLSNERIVSPLLHSKIQEKFLRPIVKFVIGLFFITNKLKYYSI
ncbi:hypothetical protein ABWK49_27470, partial [Priestia megaterium]